MCRWRKGFFLFLFISSTAFGQQIKTPIIKDDWIWYNTMVRARVSEKWFLHLDFSYRTHDQFVKQKVQWVIRPGVIYQFSKKVSAQFGYSYFETSQFLNGYEDLMRPEHRLWQRLTIRDQWNRFEIRHRYRLEERWQQDVKNGHLVPNDYSFFWRFGYQFYIAYPINQKKIESKTFYIYASDEVMLNFGHNILNIFDQNRIVGGLGYQLNDSFTFTGHYQYTFGIQPNSAKYYSINAFVFGLNLNFDWRKPKK